MKFSILALNLTRYAASRPRKRETAISTTASPWTGSENSFFV
jgi:hypothetical protein